jgi:hypothetical protein
MIIRRISVGLVAALMLSVSSMAAACDLSCSFARQRSDCHAQEAKHVTLADSSMPIDDLAMAGMAMPEMTGGGEVQAAVSAKLQPRAAHPSIGQMRPCERQSCDNGSAVSAGTARTATPQFHLILAPIEALLAARASPIFHDARDGIATPFPRDGSPLLLSLRI